MRYIAIRPITTGMCRGCVFLSNVQGSCVKPININTCCPSNKHTFIYIVNNIILNKQIKVL